jgi:hypothetical protein
MANWKKSIRGLLKFAAFIAGMWILAGGSYALVYIAPETCFKCHLQENHMTNKLVYTNLPIESKYLREIHETRNYKNLDEIRRVKGIPFIHRTHVEDTIEGQEMHCNSCHFQVKARKHYEVPKEICFLCHFKNTRFNEGRSRCDFCHEVPLKLLQKQKSGKADNTGKPITHKSLKEGGVSCMGCHYELIKRAI